MTESVYSAKPEDGKELSRILESSTNNGLVDLIYTRRPDAYESYMKEPGEPRVFVVRKDGRIITTCAELVRDVYIGGKESKAAYICGLKKDHDYTGSAGISAKLVRDFQRDDIDFYYFGVMSDNSSAKDMFEKKMSMLSINKVMTFRTYILNPNVRIKAHKHSYTFRQATKDDLPALLDYLNKEGSKKDLFPVIKSPDSFHNLHTEDFYMLMNGSEILSCAALWNSTDYKQYVVKKYSILAKIARIANPLVSALGYVKLPKENVPLDFPTLSFFVTKDENPDNYFIMLNEIRKEIHKQYEIYAFDLPDGHFANEALAKVPKICFRTTMYSILFPWSGQKYRMPDPDNISVERGLL